MKFRSKLICILAVPILALVVIAGSEARTRYDQASHSARLGRLVDLQWSGNTLAGELQAEAVATAEVLNGGAAAGMTNARAGTDAALSSYETALGHINPASDPNLSTAVATADHDLAELSTIRSAVDAHKATSDSIRAAFSATTTALVDEGTVVAGLSNRPALTLEIVNLTALSRATDATAQEWAILSGALGRRALTASESQDLAAAVGLEHEQEAVFDGTATDDQRAAVHRVLALPTANTIAVDLAAASAATPDLSANVTTFDKAMAAKVDGLHTLEAQLTSDVRDRVSAATASEQQAWRLYLAGVLIVICLSLFMAIVVSRAITRPLRRLTDAADALAHEQLPALIASLRSPGAEDASYLSATIRPLETKARDEVGHLTRAFNTVQTVAVDVAAEQAALLRKGIGDLFVNLARRNQVLIDRQLDTLDRVEMAEQDPDKLSHLFELDHLATRMRRNAESLLVLAGVDSPRRRTKPVALLDVVRSAISEVEDYSRVDVARLDDIELGGIYAADLSHVIAELVENATRSSPPESRVGINGRHGRNGYVLVVTDDGIGMSDTALAEANTTLAEPPVLGLAAQRSLGFVVIGRLAARLGVSVRLSHAADSTGVRAVVSLPRHLLAGEAEPEGDTPPPVAAVAETHDDDDTADDYDTADDDVVSLVHDEPAETEDAEGDLDAVLGEGWSDDEVVVYDDDAVEATTRDAAGTAPESLMEAVPQGRAFDEGLASLMRGEAGPAPVEPPLLLPHRGVTDGEPDDPRRAQFDEMFPPLHDTGPEAADDSADPAPAPADHPAPAPAEPEPAAAAEPVAVAPASPGELIRRVRTDAVRAPSFEPGRTVAAPTRSPDEVRALLSRYRAGLEQGRNDSDPAMSRAGDDERSGGSGTESA